MGSGKIASIFIGRSDEERAALERLISQEDTIFEFQPNEGENLMVHAHADINRGKLLNGRMKLLEATTDRKSNRNFWATILIGGVIFIKTDFHTLAAIAQFIASL